MATPKIHSCDIAIAGAGAPGLTLGLLLAGAGLDVVVIDPAPAAPPANAAPSGRTVALMNSSLNILKAAGMTSPEPLGQPMRTMRILDASAPGGKMLEAAFNATEIGVGQFGFNIPNAALMSVLYGLAHKAKGLSIHQGVRFKSCRPNGRWMDVELENGPALHCRLLVGADGRNSAVREASGIKASHHDYGQNAITFLIGHSRPHDFTSTEFHRPGGPLAFVPMPDAPDGSHRSSIVWVERTEKAEALLRLKKDELIQTLEAESNGILGKLSLESPPESWPLAALKSEALIAPRTALVAEAAHVLSPITAQGLNLSLRDVAALAEEVTDAARAGSDIGGTAILDRYARRRRADMQSRVRGVDGLMRLVSTEHPALRGLRRTGLAAVSNLPPLKALAMQHGLAPTLDEGRLAAGQPL